MSTVPASTTDFRALASSSLLRTRNGETNDQSGTLVHVGDGLYLTAGHVMYQYSNPETVRSAEDYRLTVRDGLDGAYTVEIDDSAFADTFFNLGWGTAGGADISAAFTTDRSGFGMPMLIHADPNDAQGPLTTVGYPNVDGHDGSTMIGVTGHLSANAHATFATGNGETSVLVSDIGMQVRAGQSGSGMWLTADPDGDGAASDYLAGIVTLDIAYPGGLHAVGFEPLGDIYAALGDLIEAAGLSARDFARSTLVSGQSPGSSATEVVGTLLWEDLFGGLNDDTLDGGGGKDRLYGGLGSDVLIDGGGVDNLTGDAGADTFRLARDGATDVIRDFQDGIDTIDIAAWKITSYDQLTVEAWGAGKVMVRGAGEKLVIDDGTQTLDAGDIDAADFVFAADVVNTITGTENKDQLYGTIGDDAIHDLGGVDALVGRGGADTFVLSLDGEVDWIKDFEVGSDLIDLAAWVGAQFHTLSITDAGPGKVAVSIRDETLVIMDQARSLAPGDLTEQDFRFGMSDHPGALVMGTAAGEKLYGTAFADILLDRGGTDALWGREGADRFEFVADGAIDYLKDFEPGVDVIYLESPDPWDFEDLTLRTLQAGKVLVSLEGEDLIVSDTDRTLTAEDLTARDFTDQQVFY